HDDRVVAVTEAAAKHCLVSQTSRKPNARREVRVISLHPAAAARSLSRDQYLQLLHIEIGKLIVGIGDWSVGFPARGQIQRQPRSYVPVILNIDIRFPGAETLVR